jgi:tetratricopeptide (TPR) repeat protein
MRLAPALVVTFGLLAGTATAPLCGEPEGVAVTLRTIEQLRESGDVEGAAKRATDLVAKHPEDLQAHLAFQDVQLALGRDKDVLDTYRAAARQADANADAHYLYARLLRGAAAVSEFRLALKADPHHFWTLCGLGVELTHQKSYPEARATLDEAARQKPDSAVPRNAIGRLEEARGRNSEAEKEYRAAIELAPDLVIARVNLGILLVGMNRQDDAMKTLNDAAARAPKDPMPLLGIGMAYTAAKDLKSAADAYKKAVELDTRNVTSLNLLANAYINLDQTELADAALQQAIKAAPDSVATKVNLAYLRVLKAAFDEAEKYAMAALADDDTSAEAHYVLGLVFDHQANPRKAEIEFHKAEKLDDENSVFARAVAALAASQGDWKTAISEYTKVVKMTGATGDSLMDLAGAYTGAEKPKNAASTYEQVVAAEPGRLDAWLQLGIVCRRDLRDNKRAAKAFHEYVNRGGTDARVPGWIAAIEGK